MIDTRTRIAIVGMGAVLPGAADLAAFWRMVSSGNTAVRRAPPGRWTLRVDEAVAEGVAPDRVYSPYGCFLDDEQTSESRLTNAVQQVGVGGLSARATLDVDVLARLDPLYRLLVIAGCEAWADAVMRPIDRLRVGVIVGNIALPTSGASQLAERILLSGGLNPEPLCLNRYVAGLPAGLLAAALGLRGGAYALDAACASSLYAVKLAADELLAQRADAMLAGGVSRPDCLYTQMGFSQLRALSASGRCAPFDHRADGLVVGEGAGVFVLKRLDDALAHGDRIYAVIAGCGLSNDVGGNLMSPDSEGQLRAMRAAYRAAGFAPHEVDLVECHGTGTPIGDAVEFRSMSALWREAEVGRRCAIGSVKSNVGHLLTGAGAAGLVKTLLAMQHETLPPSANFERPARDVSLDGGPFRVLGEATPWPKRMDGQPRRAAVSAFGFGGINAHLVLEEWRESGQWSVGSGQRGGAMSAVRRLVTPDGVPEALDSNIGCPIAVIGVAAHVGPWVDAKAVARRVFGEHDPTPPTLSDNSAHVPLPTDHDPLPRDLRIAALDVPTDQYRIPPAELAEMLPQQLLMLEVAYAAMEDAGIAVNDAPAGGRVDMGVFVGIELDMNTTNFHLRWALPEHARRWARESGRATDGPTFGAWLAELRDEVSPPLSANRTMGALGGIVASRVARLLRVGGPSFAISSEEASGLHAVIAARRALELGELRVALAGAVDLPCDMRAMLAGGDAGDKVVADGAAAVILKRLDDAVADGDRVYAVLGDVTTTSGGPIGDVNDSGGFEAGRLGDCGAASGMVSFVAACLALDRKRLPVSSEGDKAGSPAVRQPQYWLHNRADGPRRATVMTRSVGGGEVGMVVEEATRGGERTGLGIRDSGLGDQPRREALILVCGDGPAEVLAALDRLESQARASGDESIHSLAARAWREGNAAWTSGAGRLCASLVVRDRRELIAIVGDARRAVLGGETLRRDNIAFSPRPLLVRGGSRPWSSLAFVYPGAGSQFLGMGRDWAVEWPDVMRRLDEENERLADQFAGGKFWTAGSRGEIREADVAFGQVWLGALVTDVLARFGVRPGAAIGYSLGESAALFSLRAWRDRDDMLRRMERSPLFTEELAGPCRAARRTWNLPDDEAVDWRLGMVDRPAEEVRRALEHLETTGQARAYLLIVNTPRECVVGGQRAAVERLVADLGCAWHAIDGVTTVHCEVARCVAEDYRRLHLLPTHPPEGVRFYSGSWGRSYELASDAAADSIVAQAVAAFDFTQVIETAYADGARFFLEIGPGASCTRMIGETLGAVGGGREHVALPLCVAPLRSHAALLRVLAVLAAEGYPVDLAPLYDAADEVSCGDADATGRRTMRIDVHRTSFEMASLATPSGYAQTPSGRADTGNTLSADDADFTDGGARLRGGDVGGDVGGGGRVARSNQVVGGGQVASALLACGVGDERRARLLAAAERRGRIVERIVETEREKSLAEERYLLLSARTTTVTAKARAWRAARFLDSAGSAVVEPPSESRTRGDDYGREHAGGAASPMGLGTSGEPPRRLDRDQCLEFATGSIAAVLGPMFAEADKVPTRVRLPDEPLMLVDRIV
ncbi:MAG: beta-ketoacyl synthase N-terminal-like domain-containing protein [Pirellulales bacterium]